MIDHITTDTEVRIYDLDDGTTFDRYTVIWEESPEMALAIGETGNVPNGVCMHVDYEEGPHLGKRISIADVPSHIRRAIDNETREIAAER